MLPSLVDPLGLSVGLPSVCWIVGFCLGLIEELSGAFSGYDSLLASIFQIEQWSHR